jgi:hypothetical protein
MKMRIRGNSVRLRLTRSEVAHLARRGWVEEAANIGPGATDRLVYRVETIDGGGPNGLRAAFSDGRLCVTVPVKQVVAWAGGEEVAIAGEQPTPGGTGVLTILVEKDFQCVDRDGAEDADAFPNPARVC